MSEFRFGVQVSSLTHDAKELQDLARKVEDLGYSSIFFPDHLGGNQWSPIAAMTLAALSTTNIHVGGLVLSNDYRHPVILAEELSTIHEFSNGRLEYGIGAGWLKSDYAMAGLAFDSPSKRISRLSESVDIIKVMLKGESSTYQGEFYRTENAKCITPRFGSPPLILGGGGKKMLELAAKKADIVGVNVNLSAGSVGPELVSQVGPRAFSERIEWVKQASKGREKSLELQCLTFVTKVSNGAESWLAGLVPAFGVTVEQAKEIPIVLVGSLDEVCETLLSRREQYGFSYWVIHQHEIDEFAPVVARLARS